MSYTLFISDLHLDPARPEHLEALGELLEAHAGKADALYVLGDLFEAWIGDDDDTPFNQEAISAFRSFSDNGSQLYFMHGNRDFMLGDDFAAACGGTLLEEGTVVDLYGTRALLMHGDSLCTADVEYQKFRANMRNPQWQQMILQRPLADRQQMARQLREISMAKNQGKAETIMDVTPEEVVKDMEAHGVQRLIHGHTHRPAEHHLQANGQPAKRIVLGDWDTHVWWLDVQPGEEPVLNKQPL